MTEQEQKLVDALYNLAHTGQSFEFKVDQTLIRGTRYGVNVFVNYDTVAQGIDLETGLTLFVNAVLRGGEPCITVMSSD